MNLEELFTELGLNSENGLYRLDSEGLRGVFDQNTERILEKILKPKAVFAFNKKPFILFFEDIENEEVIHQKIWHLGCPIVIICRKNKIDIYNGFSLDASQKFLSLLTKTENYKDFSYLEIVTGKTWEKYINHLNPENKVDWTLLKNIQTARDNLKNAGLKAEVANSLIGKLLFIRYLIDRKIRLNFFNQEKQALSNQNLLEILDNKEQMFNLFEHIEKKFEAELFPIDVFEKEQINENHLFTLKALFGGTQLGTTGLPLLNVYDFSIIPIEFISNIYEHFMGEENQANNGAYYTPLFLVDYILNESIDSYFKKNPSNYNCCILDPACGSGVFLVESLRKIVLQYQKLNPDFQEEINREKYKNKLRELLAENIFGIDKDPKAINVAIFSLFITLLDYQEPPDIESFTFPKDFSETNFFSADFFDLKANFNQELEKKSFDFIIGNPPWGKVESSVEKYQSYWQEREKKETQKLVLRTNNPKSKIEIKVSRKEIAQVFMIRVSDFVKNDTQIALIVTSKVLYNLESKTFRNYFLSNFKLHKIFELSSVRHEVFDKSNDPAVAPASVLFYQYAFEQDTKNNLVTHISLKPNLFFKLFKIFLIEKYDYKEVIQKHFLLDDYLFKVLVYGNVLDYQFIKRLKNDYQSIKDLINDKKRFIYGKGVSIGGGDENSCDFLYDKIFVNTQVKFRDLKPFFVNYREKESLWKYKIVHRPREKDLYQPPLLLVKKGITDNFKVISSVSLKKDLIAFTDSITSIKAYKDTDIQLLRVFSALLNSTLFSYFLIQVGTSIGIEREQAHDEDEKFIFPIVMDSSLHILVEEIEMLKVQIFEFEEKNKKTSGSLFNDSLKNELDILKGKDQNLLTKLDSLIYDAFELLPQEKTLVDYAQNISIPLIKDKKNKTPFTKVTTNQIEDYTKIFINHFEKIFTKRIKVDIYLLNYSVLISFSSTNRSFSSVYNYPKVNEDELKLINQLTKISFSEISHKLFIQQDIRIFNQQNFVIVKPNQYKHWHPAIAYLDLVELADKIMKYWNRKQKQTQPI